MVIRLSSSTCHIAEERVSQCKTHPFTMQNSGFWRAKGWVLKSQNIFTVSYLPYHQSADSLIAVCNSDVAAVRSSLY